MTGRLESNPNTSADYPANSGQILLISDEIHGNSVDVVRPGGGGAGGAPPAAPAAGSGAGKGK